MGAIPWIQTKNILISLLDTKLSILIRHSHTLVVLICVFHCRTNTDAKCFCLRVQQSGSEKALGDLKAPSSFIIHTKAPGFRPGTAKKESILNGADQSMKDLKTERVCSAYVSLSSTDHWVNAMQVETYFLHSPDPTVPLEVTLDAVQEVYKSKRFKKVRADPHLDPNR